MRSASVRTCGKPRWVSLLFWIGAGTWPWVCSAVRACDTPVYRYALQNWPPDDYEVVVVHRGGEDAETVLKEWRDAALVGNLIVREVNLSQTDDVGYGALLAEVPPQSLPWVYLRYPVRDNRRRMAWAGAFRRGESASWLSSPLRETIAQELGAGKAAVWLFLESGNSRKDERAMALLSRELARLERVLTVPPECALSVDRFSFSVLRLSRDTEEESALRALLMGSEPDLLDYVGEPMVFPIFGRGLVLYALIGQGINERTIAEAAEFLTGPCACEIKSQNPGLELLMRADWEGDRLSGARPADFFQKAGEVEARVRELEEAAVARWGETDLNGTASSAGIRRFFSACPLWASGCPPAAILLLAGAGFWAIFTLRRLRRLGGPP